MIIAIKEQNLDLSLSLLQNTGSFNNNTKLLVFWGFSALARLMINPDNNG